MNSATSSARSVQGVSQRREDRERGARRFALRVLLALIPYACVAIGLHLFRSAWAALLSYHAAIALVLALRRGRNPRSRALHRQARNAGIWDSGSIVRRGWSTRAGFFVSLFCAGCGPTFVVRWPIIARDAGGPSPSTETLLSILGRYGLSGWPLWVFLLWYSSIHPILEGVFWGSVLDSHRRTPTAEDLLFAGYHMLVLPIFIRLPWAFLSFVILAGIAWIWRRIAHEYGGLAIPVLSHAVASVSTAAAILALAHPPID